MQSPTVSSTRFFSTATARREALSRAKAAQDFVQSAFYDDRARLYRPTSPKKPDALPFDFMWGNGVAFSALVGGLRLETATYRPLVDAFFAGLDRHFDRDAPIPAYDAYFASKNDDDKYYDDNAWMVLTFAEAFEITRDPKFLQRAALVQRYVLSGWDDRLGGGIYWKQDHRSKNTCSNGPAAMASMALAGFVSAGYHEDWARKILAWTDRTLRAPEGLYFDNIDLAGKVETTRWTYNAALMLRSNLALFHASGDRRFLDNANSIARACETRLINPDTGAFRDDALFSHLLVEAFLELWKTTREPFLKVRVEKNAAFAWSLHDEGGGFSTKWAKAAPKESHKTLIANTSVARLLWLVAAADSS